MKIVDVCAFYAPRGGGVKTYIDRKLAVGAALGHEIVVIAPGSHDHVEDRPGGGRIIHLASPQLLVDRRYRYFDDPGAVHRCLDDEQPDFVEASSPWRTATIVADWEGPAPRSLVMHADPMAAYAYRWFGRFGSRAAIDKRCDFFWQYLRRLGTRFDGIVCANSRLSARLRGGGIGGVATVPMGVDPGVFSPEHRDPSLRRLLLRRCALPESASLLLGVGRLAAEKRWPLVIDACRAVSHDRPVGLILVGDGRDRAALVRHIGGNPHIHMLAPIADRPMLARLMASADALVHGCEAETFGLVAAEAAASGLPLVVPDEGGAADFAGPDNGEVYAAGDARQAAAAIVRLLDRDRESLWAGSRAAAAAVPAMDDHFALLFAHYRGLQQPARRVA